MKLSLVDEPHIPPDLDEAVRAGLCSCFPGEAPIFSKTRAWHGSAPQYSVVLEDEAQVVAHVGVTDRAITVGSRRLRVAGVQNVYVLPPYRAQGFSRRVLGAAMAEAVRRQFDCGMLFCLPSLEKLYASCGWKTLGRRPVVRVEDDRELPAPEKNITMFYPMRVTAFPAGLIHLRGNDW